MKTSGSNETGGEEWREPGMTGDRRGIMAEDKKKETKPKATLIKHKREAAKPAPKEKESKESKETKSVKETKEEKKRVVVVKKKVVVVKKKAAPSIPSKPPDNPFPGPH